MNILLIAGGWSTERDVSLAGGKGVEAALKRLGHKVTVFDPATGLHALAQAVEGKDFAFINLHGSPGEDGLIQAMLEEMGCPYQGSGPVGSILALNKAASKMFFVKAGLPTAAWELLTSRPAPGWRPSLPFPLFIKANTGGSSLGMERVDSESDLEAALDRLFGIAKEFLVEPLVQGTDVTCGVLGELVDGVEVPKALPPIMIRAKNKTGLFDYASKYIPGGAEEICPAPISAKLTARIQELALAAHNCLGLSGYSRSDFMVPDLEAWGEPVLLETNTLPGMTSNSLLPQEAAAEGMGFDQLIERLIELGLARSLRVKAAKACVNSSPKR